MKSVSSFRLIGTLGGAGALAGFALVFAFEATQPRIQAYKEKMLRAAIAEVLHDPARFTALCLRDGVLTNQLPTGVARTEMVYLGYGHDGAPVGFAIAAHAPGFQDQIALIFGYDPRTKKVLGMRVLESKETPGLGDKIEKDRKWVDQFEGPVAPIVGVKAGRGTGKPGEVDTITGATISSKAVIRILNTAIAKWSPSMEAYLK